MAKKTGRHMTKSVGVSGTPTARPGRPDAASAPAKPSWAELALEAGVAPQVVRKFAVR